MSHPVTGNRIATGGRRITTAALFTFVLLAAASVAADVTDDFLERHWTRPLAAQGEPPAQYSAAEASLAPSDCAQCHPDQYRQWSGSLHAAAMGPGLMGQLRDYAADDLAGHQQCLRCHAPLAEQAADLSAELAGTPPANGNLHRAGLACAACHVRGHQRFGPPRRDGSVPMPDKPLPHAGWVVSDAFQDSRFCAACHQFEADGYALNGKLLENTVAEWQASRHAREGRSCQACHMPDRQHLWRGIHDPKTTRAGVTITSRGPLIHEGDVTATLTVRNSGTGHHFPTYVTPRIVFEAYQVDAAGDEIAGTRNELWIARAVTADLSEELFDSRIPADGELDLDYRATRAAGAVAVMLRLRVEPDAFYTDFYRTVLADGGGAGRAELEEALRASLASHYTLHEERLALPN